jgi:polysaccharide export outer membrane protein
MLRKILVLMIAVMPGVSLPVLSWAGTGDASPVEASPPKAEGSVSDATSPFDTAPDEERYVIGLGDMLDISVWKDEALSRSCVVRPDGAISLPLIGDLQAAGKTTSQLKAEIEKKLDRYVPGAIVSLDIKQVNSMIFYVIGKVNSPGRFVMNADVDVLQALATAGGLNIYAKRNSIKIFRDDKNETTIFPFEYDEVVDGKRLEENIKLKRGDVVVIP